MNGCFACGGLLSVRTGDFQRCVSCRAENYRPLSDVPTEERVRSWFHRRDPRALGHGRNPNAIASEASVS